MAHPQSKVHKNPQHLHHQQQSEHGGGGGKAFHSQKKKQEKAYQSETYRMVPNTNNSSAIGVVVHGAHVKNNNQKLSANPNKMMRVGENNNKQIHG